MGKQRLWMNRLHLLRDFHLHLLQPLLPPRLPDPLPPFHPLLHPNPLLLHPLLHHHPPPHRFLGQFHLFLLLPSPLKKNQDHTKRRKSPRPPSSISASPASQPA